MARPKNEVSTTALLSSAETMENNNNKEDTLFQPLDVESVDFEVKKKSKIPVILGVLCIGVVILIAIGAIAAYAVISSRGEAIPQNKTTSQPSSTVTSTTESSTVSSSILSTSSTSSTTLSSTSSQITKVTAPVNKTSSTTTTTGVTTSSSTTTTSPSTSTLPMPKCEVDQFQCKDGSCINKLHVCDGSPNCLYGEDESANCSCTDAQFRCHSGQCIPKDMRCDGQTQCRDLSDEMNCTGCTGFECASGLCLYPRSVRCNGVKDCPDLSDEINDVCDNKWSSSRTYEQCTNGRWIHFTKFCDGVDDCYDNSDETTNCEEECSPAERMCHNGLCILGDWWCDGHLDCPDHSDEKYCGSCGVDQFQCSDYTCINKTGVCDGVIDCTAGTDEHNCVELKGDANLMGTSGAVAVQFGGEILPVCSEGWSKSASDRVCQLMGKEDISSYTSVDVTVAGFLGSQFLNLNQTRFTHNPLLQSLYTRSSCVDNKVVSVSCQPKVCGERKVNILSPFVVGGDLSADGKWPWMTSLSLLGQDICGASLISDQWVLTAAHCIVLGADNFTSVPFNFEVMLGTSERTREPNSQIQRIPVKHIYLHPKYKALETGVIDWDFALLQLSKPVSYTDYIQPVCLPGLAESFPTSSLCYLAGWGNINTDLKTVKILREAKMQIWDDESCRTNTVTGENSVNINSTLCAGYKSGFISACQGDSGGPLMCGDGSGHWTLAGVMSSGSGGCTGDQRNKANRFGRVSATTDWIHGLIS